MVSVAVRFDRGSPTLVISNQSRVQEAEVFTRGADGELLADWQATLSHEVLEMIADPAVNLYARRHVRSPAGVVEVQLP